MATLSLSTFTIPNSTKQMTLIWYNDTSIPKGVRAFFRLDPRIHNRVKCRVKDKDGLLRGNSKNMINAALHAVAKQYDYNWERLVEAARRSR